MNEELNLEQTESNGDLASFIDAENGNNGDFRTASQMLEVHPEKQEHPVRKYQRVMNEYTKKVEPGALFSAHFVKAEWANTTTGFPFLRITVQLDANGWTMSHTHFIDRKKCNSEAEIQCAGTEYLCKYGYHPRNHNLKELPILVEIGSWKSDDGKEHLNVKRIYRDKADYDSYQEWLKNRPAKQPKVRKPVSLPDNFN